MVTLEKRRTYQYEVETRYSKQWFNDRADASDFLESLGYGFDRKASNGTDLFGKVDSHGNCFTATIRHDGHLSTSL